MKSDIKVVQFNTGLKKSIGDKLQIYLNGENDWNEAIMEKDIIDVKMNLESLILLHRAPMPKITS